MRPAPPPTDAGTDGGASARARRRRTRLTWALYGAAVTVAALIIVASGFHFERGRHAVPARPAPAQPGAGASRPPLRYVGLYEPASPASYSGVSGFTHLVGARPNIAVYYSSWFERFQLAFADSARANGAIPMVQVEPRDISLAKIAAGDYDSYLKAYARTVRHFGTRVILAFGHEMNADWYGWGYRHTSPATYIRAWRHVHDVFTAAGARNVTWLWVVNVAGGPHVTSIRQWWPGAAYVTWVGVDGHYFNAGVKFPELFGGTLGQVRNLTGKPVLVSEAGIAPGVSAERIADLFSGAWAHGLIGVVWFDVSGHNIRVETHPEALRVLKNALARYAALPGARPSG